VLRATTPKSPDADDKSGVTPATRGHRKPSRPSGHAWRDPYSSRLHEPLPDVRAESRRLRSFAALWIARSHARRQMSSWRSSTSSARTHIAPTNTRHHHDDSPRNSTRSRLLLARSSRPPTWPVGVRDWAGTKSRAFIPTSMGIFNGLTYSTFAVNPPTQADIYRIVLDMCMNDRGSGVTPDPFLPVGLRQFCYEWTFMPVPDVRTWIRGDPHGGLRGEYNHPDCAYPDATPAISEVDGDGVGPWVSAGGHTITIHAFGRPGCDNYGYSGPRARHRV